MRERLTKLLGKTRVSQLKMGTFHSLCARFLRKYAKLVDVPENFTVCDASETSVMDIRPHICANVSLIARKSSQRT